MNWYIEGLKVMVAFSTSFLMILSMVLSGIAIAWITISQQETLYLIALAPWLLLWGFIPEAFGKIMDWSDR